MAIYTNYFTPGDVPNMEEMIEHSGAHALLHKPIDLQKLSDTIYGFVGHLL